MDNPCVGSIHKVREDPQVLQGDPQVLHRDPQPTALQLHQATTLQVHQATARLNH